MDKNFIDIVPQTSRTILFEKINERKIDGTPIPSLIEIVRDSLDGNDKLQEVVDKTLAVRSFEEFLEKFEPVIYQTQSADENGNPVFSYSYTKDSPSAKPKKIVDELFYKMVQEFIRMKSESGKSNLNTLYTKIDELLAPEKALDEARQKRKQIESLLMKKQEAEQRHRSEEAKKYNRLLMKLEKEVYDKYKDDAFELIPLAIADTQQKLEKQIPMLAVNDTQVSENTTVEGKAPKLLTGGRFVWDEGGKLTYKPSKSSETADGEEIKMLEGEQKSPLLIEMQKVADKMEVINGSPVMYQLFLDNFAGNNSDAQYTEDWVYEESERLRNMTDIYKDAKEKFYTAIITLVQKVLDVEMYFRHATQGGTTTPQPLIVANCNMNEALQGDYLKKYLELANGTKSTRIFFAILPPVEHTEFVESDDDDEDFFDRVEGFTGDATNLNQMLKLLANEGIISFFNFKANERTSFSQFNKDVLDSYEEIIDEIPEKTFSVLCYPNFTVIPKYETDRLILKAQNYKGEELVEDTRLSINAVYVDSAYVSAGIAVASQDREILKAKGYSLKKPYPCSRFDLEEEFSNFLTFFNMENFMNWTEAFEDSIYEKKFGFCFSSNDKIINGKKIRNTYFYFTNNNEGDPLYSVLTERVIRYYFKDVSRDNSDCEQVASNIMSELKTINATPDKKFANVLLRTDKGETLEAKMKPDEIEVKIKFASSQKARSLVVNRNKRNEN